MLPPSQPRSSPRGVYGILNHPSSVAPAPESRLRAWAQAGVRFVQLRAKGGEADERIRLVHHLGPIAAGLGVALVINDDIEAAAADVTGIWGVHLGQEDHHSSRRSPGADAALRRLRRRGRGLGLSTHNLEQVAAAALVEPDYIGFGPVFSTSSKLDTAPVTGIEALGLACRHYEGPVDCLKFAPPGPRLSRRSLHLRPPHRAPAKHARARSPSRGNAKPDTFMATTSALPPTRIGRRPRTQRQKASTSAPGQRRLSPSPSAST